jgi:hypothetical protein
MAYRALLPQPLNVAAILAEHQEAEARVLGEGTWRTCDHAKMDVRVHYGSTFDDHSTAYGYCRACDTWLVVTDYASGQIEARPMTGPELDRLQTRENQARNREWIHDFQAGCPNDIERSDDE